MDIHAVVAKVRKDATLESGDTLEMIERPGGGLSWVLVDGQRSGRAAKSIANMVARKAVGLLAEGVRDGAAARAASDYLYAERSGQVTATLNIISVDMTSSTLVITRNNPEPAYLISGGAIEVLDQPSQAVGTRRTTRPVISQVPLTEGLAVVVFTDGLSHAGERSGQGFAVGQALEALLRQGAPPSEWADRLLAQAVALDDGRPSDDISVLVVSVGPRQGDEVRRLWVRLPL
jgi:serine phosphatase RsbU (regulator of sigma subunit)